MTVSLLISEYSLEQRSHALLYIVISNVIPSCHIVNRQQSDRDHVTNFESNSFSYQLCMGMLLSKSTAQP